ncbi:MAG: CopG family transcriptional regulator [Caulobacteraceae bacterium]|nr:CopG family transcriptional regulator [Caulobacteraceae bacterium]
MAQPKTIFDETDEALEAAAITQARTEIAAGKGIPHEVVGEWLRRLARGESSTPPPLD